MARLQAGVEVFESDAHLEEDIEEVVVNVAAEGGRMLRAPESY